MRRHLALAGMLTVLTLSAIHAEAVTIFFGEDIGPTSVAAIRTLLQPEIHSWQHCRL
jgi:hypothetical protein